MMFITVAGVYVNVDRITHFLATRESAAGQAQTKVCFGPDDYVVLLVSVNEVRDRIQEALR